MASRRRRLDVFLEPDLVETPRFNIFE